MPVTTPATISELCARAEEWARGYYRRQDGSPTGAANNVADSLRPLTELAGYDPPSSIRAELLYDCRQLMLDQGLSRRTINDRLRKIKLVIKWAARPPRRWITPEIVADATLTEPLRRGRTDAPEGPGVKPVAWELVEATINAAPAHLGVMLRLHWLTGMRPGEVVGMAKSLITDLDGLLLYCPTRHKTAHLGNKRQIVLGTKGAALCRAWIMCCATDRLFPIETTSGYRNAVRTVNKTHKLTPWAINQIRHAYLTRVGKIDLDGARAQAGHALVETTQIYMERDLAKAIAVQRLHG